jgi:predicted ATPase
VACRPLNAGEALRFAAVQLFVEHLRAFDGSFVISDSDARAIAEICARLDGLPLAIELAATRVPLFGLRGLADRLDDRFSILTKGRRTAVPRHQTLGAMVGWSYEGLSDVDTCKRLRSAQVGLRFYSIPRARTPVLSLFESGHWQILAAQGRRAC